MGGSRRRGRVLEGRLERRPSGWFVVCGLQQAPSRAHGGVLSSCGIRLGDAGLVITGLASWSNPQSMRALLGPEPGSSLSFLNNKALPALDLSFLICKVLCNLILQPGSNPLGSFLSLLCRAGR